MKKILDCMEHERKLLKDGIKKAESDIRNFPEGRLRISYQYKKVRYYLLSDGEKGSGKYIRKEETGLVRALAQKHYNKHFLYAARTEMGKIERAMQQLDGHDAKDIYNKLPEERKLMVKPYIQTTKMVAEEWQKQPFEASSYEPKEKIYRTKRGEMVRTKSEEILADLLFDLGIPYRYEQLLYLKGGVMKAPDFTLFDAETRKIFYWEHFGLLEDRSYLIRNLKKVDTYRLNGIYTGKNLIITHEATGVPLDIPGIRNMLKEIFRV